MWIMKKLKEIEGISQVELDNTYKTDNHGIVVVLLATTNPCPAKAETTGLKCIHE